MNALHDIPSFVSHAYFASVAQTVEQRLLNGEIALTLLAAEESDFIRFNAGKVRQTGRVRQAVLTLRLIDGQRQAFGELSDACLQRHLLEVVDPRPPVLRHGEPLPVVEGLGQRHVFEIRAAVGELHDRVEPDRGPGSGDHG